MFRQFLDSSSLARNHGLNIVENMDSSQLITLSDNYNEIITFYRPSVFPISYKSSVNIIMNKPLKIIVWNKINILTRDILMNSEIMSSFKP